MNRLRSWALILLLVLWAAPHAARCDTVVHTERSQYRNIIVSDSFGERCMRFRVQKDTKMSCMNLSEPNRLVFDCTKMMLGALFLQPSPQKVLIIGLGGGSLPRTIAGLLPSADIDVVEIDPAVVRVAGSYFGFKPGPRLHVSESDGRVFVKRAIREKSRYDLIMLDAFDQDYIPEHLLTRDFLNETRQILAPGGVLAANTFSYSRLYDSESTTYERVYGRFFNLKKSFSNSRVILVRQNGLPTMDEVRRNAAAFTAPLRQYGVDAGWLLSLFSTEQDWNTDAPILTDQYSPSNILRNVFF